MRRLAIVLLALLSNSALASTAGAEVITQVSRSTSSGVTASPCTGETLAFTTTSTSVLHFVSTPTGASRLSGTVTLAGSATGLATGASYSFGGAAHSLGASDGSSTFTLTFVLVSRGDGPNLVQHQTIAVHTDAQGQPTVEVNETRFDCI